MKILALDSSGLVASVAVMEDDILTAEYNIQHKKTHSQTLLPMMDEIRKMINLDVASLDAVALAAGPGSFTGLRIGSATAKGLAFALNKPVVPVPTVDGLAYQMYGAGELVCPIMDARRSQVYTGIYEFQGEELIILEDQMAVSIEELGERLCAYDREVIFLGDGVPVFANILVDSIMAGRKLSFAPAHMNRQRAASFAMLAFQYLKEKKSGGALLGAAFLMATSAIGPGFLTQTAQFTGTHKGSFGFVILVSIILAAIAQVNIWRVLCVSGMRGQDVANKVLPGLGYFVAFMVALGGLAFNIGNVGGGALGFNTLLGIPTQVGCALAGVIAIAVFLVKNAKSAMDTLAKVLGGVMIVVIFGIIIVVRPPMGDALKNTFVPSAGAPIWFRRLSPCLEGPWEDTLPFPALTG